MAPSTARSVSSSSSSSALSSESTSALSVSTALSIYELPAPPSSNPSCSAHPFSLLNEYMQKGHLSKLQCLDLGQDGGLWRAHVVASSLHDEIWQHIASAPTKAAAKKLAAATVLAEFEASSSAPESLELSKAEKKAKAAETRSIQHMLAELLSELLLTTGLTSPLFLFLSIDLEFYEMDHQIVTEIGLAWCRSSKFINRALTPPGCCAHYIVTEHKFHRNSQFVPDEQDHFGFGLSKEVRLADVAVTITEEIVRASNGLPVVLVGHSMEGDLARLYELGVDLEELVSVEFDIAIALQALEEAGERTSLGNMLNAFGISHAHLHNAGNDAVYTLAAARHVLAIAGTESRQID